MFSHINPNLANNIQLQHCIVIHIYVYSFYIYPMSNFKMHTLCVQNIQFLLFLHSKFMFPNLAWNKLLNQPPKTL